MPMQQISVSPLDWGKENLNNTTQDQEWRMQEQVYVPPQSQQPQQIGHERCASQASTLSTNHDICRICHCEGDSDAPLIAPCYCSGSLRHVHEACLQQWIKSSDIRSCELCKFQFVMQSKIKPFAEWEKLDMSPVERRKLACSVTFYGVALACVGWSLYVLIDRIAEEAQRDFLKWPFWTKLVVVAVGFTGGLFFMHVQCKAYLGLLRRWRAFNRIIRVQNAPDRPPREEDEERTSKARSPEEKSAEESTAVVVVEEESSGGDKGGHNMTAELDEEEDERSVLLSSGAERQEGSASEEPCVGGVVGVPPHGASGDGTIVGSRSPLLLTLDTEH